MTDAVASATAPGMTDPAAELAIRAARAAFNTALEGADLDAIGAVLAKDAVLVTGTDSGVIAGRKAQLLVWKREFAAPPGQRTHYVRTAESITPSPVEPIAMELGHWTGSGADGAIQASGCYSAKWRLVGGRWLIEAEIYVTLA